MALPQSVRRRTSLTLRTGTINISCSDDSQKWVCLSHRLSLVGPSPLSTNHTDPNGGLPKEHYCPWSPAGLTRGAPGSSLPQACTGSGAGGGTGGLRGAKHKPGGREGLPVSLPLDGWGWEALSTAGQPDPLAWLGVHYPRLVPVQKQPAEQAPHSHWGGPLHKSLAFFSPARFSFLEEQLCSGQNTTTNDLEQSKSHLRLPCLPHRPPPLPQNLDGHLPALYLCYSVLDLGPPALCNPSINFLPGPRRPSSS